MKSLSMSSFLQLFTPAHKRPVDEHLLQDETTTRLIADTERLLRRMADNATGKNERRTIRRRQKDWDIKVKISYKHIRLLVADTKHSRSPVHKRIRVTCYRKYVRSANGVGLLREATIHYLKDGRMHVRSVQHSSLFKGILYGINRIDLAYVGGKSEEASFDLLATREEQLKSKQANDIHVLSQEAKRYVQTMQQFSLDPMLENKLTRILAQVKRLEDDFSLLGYEEKHTVRRLLKEDLPSLMGAYLALSKANQMEQKDNVFVSLSKMELSLIGLNGELETTKIERMEHVLRLQELRYDQTKPSDPS
ncbi:hypothetical protein [Shouchella shacheensis]|uniref:hypothetical protein n=1 Tax=Shouchella shacheensis TaxID=1649580 RepID=UPI000AC8403B|nr:hypothetical protein [Shouchella shacheensis]